MTQETRQPDWFYDRPHVVEEGWEKAAMSNRQAGLTWWENGPVSPRSDAYRELAATAGRRWSWNSLDDLRKFDGGRAEVGEIEVHASTHAGFLVLRAIRIDRREGGITYGTQIQMRVQHA